MCGHVRVMRGVLMCVCVCVDESIMEVIDKSVVGVKKGC